MNYTLICDALNSYNFNQPNQYCNHMFDTNLAQIYSINISDNNQINQLFDFINSLQNSKTINFTTIVGAWIGLNYISKNHTFAWLDNIYEYNNQWNLKINQSYGFKQYFENNDNNMIYTDYPWVPNINILTIPHD